VNLLLIELSHNNTKYRISLEKPAIFVILHFIWSPWDIFIVQRIDKRHFVFHRKRKTMKGNIFPKLPAQVYFYLDQDKYKKKLMFV